MKEITQPPFWSILEDYGAPDAYFLPFIRVHSNYRVGKEKMKSFGNYRPLFVQLLGNDPEALCRNVEILQSGGVNGIDFNLGCPVARIRRRGVGGGLLKDLGRVEGLLKTLRKAISGIFSVKLRLGFEDPNCVFVDLCNAVGVDFISLHARTVIDLYGVPPRYEYLTAAAARSRCPILANGDIRSVSQARRLLDETLCGGVMIGRGAVRNPWIFYQWRGGPFQPRRRDIWGYLNKISDRFRLSTLPPSRALGVLKRFARYLDWGTDPSGTFLHSLLGVETLSHFWMQAEGRLNGLHADEIVLFTESERKENGSSTITFRTLLPDKTSGFGDR
jgi:tRNA-dihydrouridine synthase